MIVTKQVERKYFDTIITKFICDFCGNNTSASYPFGENANWLDHEFEIDTITIKRTTGSHYPGGVNHTIDKVDMCNKCWEEKFLPWMEENKAELRKEEID